MAGKIFGNRTPYDLSVQLTVRAGDTPGHTFGFVNVVIPSNTDQFVGYGNDSNPYLDGISLHGAGNGNKVASQETVLTRGSAVDNAFNTNDTVSFTQANQSIVMGFSNSR
jgi:hypothetical protein